MLMFHFPIKHVAGKSFGPDGLSRREVRTGEEEYPPDKDSGETNPIPKIVLTEGVPPPLEFDNFKDQLDSRGGYLHSMATYQRFYCKIQLPFMFCKSTMSQSSGNHSYIP